MGPSAGLDTVAKRKSLPMSGIEPWSSSLVPIPETRLFNDTCITFISWDPWWQGSKCIRFHFWGCSEKCVKRRYNWCYTDTEIVFSICVNACSMCQILNSLPDLVHKETLLLHSRKNIHYGVVTVPDNCDLNPVDVQNFFDKNLEIGFVATTVSCCVYSNYTILY
jgi:hypothetical protein